MEATKATEKRSAGFARLDGKSQTNVCGDRTAVDLSVEIDLRLGAPPAPPEGYKLVGLSVRCPGGTAASFFPPAAATEAAKDLLDKGLFRATLAAVAHNDAGARVSAAWVIDRPTGDATWGPWEPMA